jgi:hypothetical protein
MEVLGFILVLFALMVILPLAVCLTISLVLWMIDNAIRNTATFLDAYAAEFDYQATAR